MQRFTYDLLHDVTEDTEIIQSSETVHSIQLPAYATDTVSLIQIVQRFTPQGKRDQ